MNNPKILGISGSLRRESRNTALLREAIRLFGDCDAEIADLRLPLYDGDLEDRVGLPDEVKRLVAQIRAADGIIMVTPEYNKMIPGVLKNALDWISRDTLPPMKDKPLAILSASAGGTGGEVAQFTLRHALAPFGAHVLQGPAVVIPGSDDAFDEQGRLREASREKAVAALMARLHDAVKLAQKG